MNIDVTSMVQYFKDFADNHEQINSFGFGPVDQIQVKDRKHPLLWVSLKPSKMGSNNTQLNFDVYLLTNQNQDYDNLKSSMNDMYYIGRDLISVFYSDDVFDSFNNSYQVSFSPIMLEFDDVIGGWVYNITIDFDADYCYDKNDYV